jgi:uncharacterized protein (DUF849 family)
MFHRQFGELKASASLIRKTYLKQGIRFKTINRVKKEIDFNVEYYRDLFMTMFKLVSLSKSWNMKIVYLDEAVFSFNTFKPKAWSHAYSTINVTESKMKIKTQALLAAISEDVGLEDYLIHPKSIKT